MYPIIHINSVVRFPLLCIFTHKSFIRSYIMEHQNITMLRAVDAFQENFTVKVWVIRIWDHPDKRNPIDIYSMDMILIDEEGTKMEAVCFKRFLAQFQASLVEKQCLIVINPTIGFNNSTYKYVQNQNRIFFQSTTQVTECQDFGGSPYGFDFANFGDILNHAINESVTVDVIGYLTRSFPKEVIRNKSTGKESVKVTIEISDLENRKVYLILWDQYCDEIIAFLESIKECSCYHNFAVWKNQVVERFPIC
ncbi:putative nucleic acid-binding protein [Helianthus annuus]|nr:putative nucleic acid-binding protein [Helianthus annuus]KAJ0497847.1 putative nucleic acid-binding protein [Helianthus annuus]KAJ0663855.1 putative nucleic acid-binding protein [Helianthus annuus]